MTRNLFGKVCRGGLFPALAAACSLSIAGAQSFANLDFENAGQGGIPSDSVWLGWKLAAVGWKHAPGGDTMFVYHNPPQTLNSQYYFLVDANSQQYAPLAGNFSLGLMSGHYSTVDPNSAWVPAYIEQTGTVPANAHSLSLLATGDFSLTLNSTKIPMSNAGGDLYVGDISAFSGQTATLRIINNSTKIDAPVLVDNLNFAPASIPEPGAFSLVVVAGALVGLRRKFRRA